MRKVAMVLLMLVGGCLASGCVFVVEKNSAVGARFTSGLEFFQKASDDGSKVELDLLPWVREEIKARREAAEAVEDDG